MAMINVEIEETLLAELSNLYLNKITHNQYENFKQTTFSNNLFFNAAAKKTTLAILCDKFGSDKGSMSPDSTDHPYGWKPHSYTDFYSLLFERNRETATRIFECGIGTTSSEFKYNMSEGGKPGASLRVWQEYFPNAEIIAGDIDRNILFSENRIKCFWIDQLKPEVIRSFWEEVGSGDFDFMLDDGLHEYEAGITLFENSIHRLKQSGIYIIEDVTAKDLFRYKCYFEHKAFQVGYLVANRDGSMITTADSWSSLEDNNLIFIRKGLE